MNLEGFTSSRLFEGDDIETNDIKFQSIIVYCIDNGSYIEYDSISKLNESSKKKVINFFKIFNRYSMELEI